MNIEIKSGGDVIGAGVSGTSHIIGKTININADQLKKMPNEYAKSLEDFSISINKLFELNKIPQESVASVQESINELAEEVENVKLDEKISPGKKKHIEAKITSVVEGLLRVLPGTAETIASFTPLAPFGKLINQGVEELIKEIQNEV